jgi:orotidine-5'-phosphate decarboxylase
MWLVRLKPNILLKLGKLFPIVFARSGVGAQGGSLSEVCKYGMNGTIGLINSSRGIIYASNGFFAEKARAEALKMQQEMEEIISVKFKV